MNCRILMRFVGTTDELSAVYDALMEQYPEMDLPSEDSGDWYSVDDVMMDEYECRFEELPEGELLAMDGSVLMNTSAASKNSPKANSWRWMAPCSLKMNSPKIALPISWNALNACLPHSSGLR